MNSMATIISMRRGANIHQAETLISSCLIAHPPLAKVSLDLPVIRSVWNQRYRHQSAGHILPCAIAMKEPAAS
jgi:hypothetical protein